MKNIPLKLIVPGIILGAMMMSSSSASAATPNPSGAPTTSQFSVVDIINQLPTHPTKNYQTRQLSQIDTVVFHHAASNGSPQAIANYHINTNGWPGIAYTFYIRKSGTIYRVNNLTTICYHDSGRNTRSIGVCFEGNFDTQQMPDIQMLAGVALFKHLKDSLRSPLALDYHKNDSGKTCPGTNFPYAEFEAKINQYA